MGSCPGVVIPRGFWRGCVPVPLHITLQKMLRTLARVSRAVTSDALGVASKKGITKLIDDAMAV